MEPEQINDVFGGKDPFLRIPSFMWERLVFHTEELVANIDRAVAFLDQAEHPEADLLSSELKKDAELAYEELNRIRNQVPGAVPDADTGLELNGNPRQMALNIPR